METVLHQEKIVESIKQLSPTAKRLVDKLIEGSILWMPHKDNRPQMEAYCSEADVLYFGGAAGGGKSDLILGLALTDHQKSIVFRREYKQLRELIDRSHEILEGTAARYSNTLARWSSIPAGPRGSSSGRVLEFGAVQHEKDKENFKGRPHDFIGFDEVADFTETQFRFLMAWNRTTDEHQRCRVVCAGNPPTTPEGRWVTRYWAPWLRRDHSNRALPGELRWFAVLDGRDIEVPSGESFVHKGELITPKSRTFIPAFLKDNPYFNNTDYRAQLQSLPEPLRSQLLYGDFTIEEEPQSRQVIPTEWVRRAQDRWSEGDIRAGMSPTAVGIDPSRGGRDQTALALRTGSYFHPLRVYEGREVRDGQTCAAIVTELIGPAYAGELRVDVIGIGASAYDLLTEMYDEVIPVNFAERSFATDASGLLQMRNMRAQGYWSLREALDPETGDDLALPPDEELVEDLTTPLWDRGVSGITIESKDQVQSRLGRSPGKGDAVVLAYIDVAPGVLFR